MEQLTTNRADALLLWEISRASRDRPVFAALFAACADSGVRIGTGGRLHDLADGDDAFALDLGAALAVRESNVISKRTRRAVESRAAAGRPAGSVAYGFRRVIDPESGRTTGRDLHREQAPIVAEIIERLLNHEHAVAIAADLNRRKVPTGAGVRWLGRHIQAVINALPDHPLSAEVAARVEAGELPSTIAADLNNRGVVKPLPSRWTGGNLTRLALRPTYAGLRVHRGALLDEVRGTWPPIITEDQHHQLVALFSDPARDKFRHSTRVRHLGSGIFRCGRDGCTGRMRVVYQGGRAASYSCRACHRLSRYQAAVDGPVELLLARRLAQPDVVAKLAELGENGDTKAAAAEAAALRLKLAQAREMVDKDQISLDDFAIFRARWEQRITEAERRARPQRVPEMIYEVAGPDAAARWAALPIGAKRVILSALVEVTIMPAGRGRPAGPELIQVRWRAGLG